MTDVEQPSADAGPSSPQERGPEDTAIRAVDPRITRRGESRTSRGGQRRARKPRRHTVLKVVLSTLLALALVTGLSAAYLYRHLNGNLTFEDVQGQIIEQAPDKVAVEGPHEPLNILVMGDDTRQGKGNKIDGEAGLGGSDTTILIHLSADRQHAYGISIPRDSLVERPDCKKKDGTIVPGSDKAMWNEAYAYGGAACTISQFQHDTGVPIDYAVTVDFHGFKGMVDAVGGVEVCIPETVDDPAHGVYLKKGTRRISGDEALTYVRARYGIGDGSDLGRTRRQQAFIGAMVHQVMSANTLANPAKVVSFLNAATKSLTLSEVGSTGLGNITDLAKLGLQFKNIGLDKIKFITVPTVYGTGEDRGRVFWTPETKKIWDRLLHDRALGTELTQGAISVDHLPGQGESSNPSSSPSSSPSASSSPSSPSTSPSPGTPSGSPSQTLEPNGRTAEENKALRDVGLCT